jgi:hypothetical protein
LKTLSVRAMRVTALRSLPRRRSRAAAGGQNPVVTSSASCGLVHHDEDVERVAVLREGAGDEPVVPRIVARGIEIAVELEQPRLLVHLELAAPSLGDLDDGVDHSRCRRPRWD